MHVLANRLITILPALFIMLSRVLLAQDSPGGGDRSEHSIEWFSKMSSATAKSVTSYRPIFVMFDLEGCSWCQKMDQEVFSDAEIKKLLSHFVSVRIDIRKDQNSASKYMIFSSPTVMILGSDGQVREKVTGFISKEWMKELLQSSLNENLLSDGEIPHQEVLLKLMSDDWQEANILPEALSGLGDKQSRKELLPQLLSLDPFPREKIVGLLEHPRLSVRHGALELLEELTGTTRSYDPWLQEDNKQTLSEWHLWASGKENELQSKAVFDDKLMPELLSDLFSGKRDRENHAFHVFLDGGNEALALLESIYSEGKYDDHSLRKIKQAIYLLHLEKMRDKNSSLLAHRLVFGNLHQRADALNAVSLHGNKALLFYRDFIREADPILRETALELMLTSKNSKVLPILQKHLKTETNTNVLYVAIQGLRGYNNKTASEILISYLNHPSEDLVVGVLEVIGSHKSNKFKKHLAKKLKDNRWRVRSAALEAIKKSKTNGLGKEVSDLIEDEDEFVRYAAVEALSHLSWIGGLKKLSKLYHENDEMKGAVVSAYGKMDKALPASFFEKLNDYSVDTILSILQGMDQCKESDLLQIRDLLNHDNIDVACTSAALIAEKGAKNPDYRNRLAKVLEGDRVEQILTILDSLTMKDFISDESIAPEKYNYKITNLIGGEQNLTSEVQSPNDIYSKLVKSFSEEDVVMASGRLLKAMALLTQRKGNEGISFKACMFLAAAGFEDVVDAFIPKMANLSQSDKLTMTDILRYGRAEASMQLARVLLKSKDVSIREEAADACLSNEYASELTEVVMIEFFDETGLLRPRDIFDYQFQRAAQRGERRSYIRSACLRILKENKNDDELLILGLIGVAMTWKNDDHALVFPYTKSLNQWVRRAAYYALASGWGKALTEEYIDVIMEDISSYVREVIIYLALRNNSRNWLHYFDAENAVEMYNYRTSYYTYQEDNSSYVREQLQKLKDDESARLQVEAYLALMELRAPFDPNKLVDMISKLPDIETPGEKISRYLVNNTDRLQEEHEVLLPFLKYGRHSEDSLKKVKERFSDKATEGYEQAGETLFGAIRNKVQSLKLKTSDKEEEAKLTTDLPEASKFEVVYFYYPGCKACNKAAKLLGEMQTTFSGLQVTRFNIRKVASMQLNEALCETYGLDETSRLVTPAVFTEAGYLLKDELEFSKLADLLSRSTSVENENWWHYEGLEIDETLAGEAIEKRYGTMGLGVIFLAGLLDGLNPCAFATIIFFVSYLHVSRRKRWEILQVGGAFVLAVFVTYFVLGLGLVDLVSRISLFRWAGILLNWIIASVTLVLMIISIRDGVLCLQGKMEDITLQLPKFLKGMIRTVIRKGAKQKHYILAALISGVVISILELACTGQVYAPTILYMLRSTTGGEQFNAVGKLLLYNVAFVLPLMIVFAMVFYGLSHDKLIEFQKKHAAVVKFATAAVFGVMLITLIWVSF